MARIGAGAGDARALNTKLRARLVAFGKAAEELAGHAREIKTLRAEITTANSELREEKRGDLVVADPVRELVEIVGRQVVDPIMALHVPEYWPHSPPDGPALARLTK